ncbi:DNA polymerase kappa-like [Argopecten irradians]|uniref:DNA polymerase kappa-like n=1 Tax=Argopecten irradians TaxID=31199 RepID=UPI003714C8D4
MLEETAYDNDTEDDDEDWEDTTWGCADNTQSTKPTSCFKGEGGEPLVKPPSDNVKLPVAKGTSNEAGERGLMSRMLLNDNKAGMEGLDKDRINQVILEASKGSKYFENEKKKEEQVNKKIEEQMAKLKKIGDVQLRQGLMEADKLLKELECQRDLGRIIVHIDMDAFYAAVEMRDDPTLRDKPMAVGGYSMLSTSNYLARKFGVRAAMPGFIGKKLCPDLVMVKPNFEKYTAVSREIRSVMADYDPNYCPMSLDEAYLDITDHLEKRMQSSIADRTFLCHRSDSNKGNCECDLNTAARDAVLSARLSHQQRNSESTTDYFQRTNLTELDGIQGNELITRHNDVNNSEDNLIHNNEVAMASRGPCPLCGKPFPPYDVVTFGLSAEDTVAEMRSRINQKTRLTASAGIAPNMMLAKVCSDKNKPNGQYRIPATRDAVMEFVTDLPIRKISGIGKVSEKMLNALNIYTCYHLYHQRALLYHLYSPISFNYFMRICTGIGSVNVERDSDRKSMSTERTFGEISKPEELVRKCQELCVSLCEDLKEEKLKGKTVAIKLKTVKYEVKTRAQTLSDYTADLGIVFSAARTLLHTEIQSMAPNPLRLRLMGVRISSLLNEDLCQKKQNTLTRFVKQLGRVGSDDLVSTEKLASVGSHDPVSTEKLGHVSEKPRSTEKQERAGSDWAISREHTGNTASQNDASTILSCFDTPKESVKILTDDTPSAANEDRVTTTSEKNQCEKIKDITDKTDVRECETFKIQPDKTVDSRSVDSSVAFRHACQPEIQAIADKMSEKIPQTESVECTKSTTSGGVREIPKTCKKVNISHTCGEFMKSANDALLWDPGNQVTESLKIEGSHQDSLEGDNSCRQADSPGPSCRQADSPGPSSRQADSPGPSSRQAGSPGPSSRQAGSPGPSSRQADSPGPSSRQADSPGPSSRQADSPGPFVCPVCQDEVVCEDLSEFNQHIDICLNKKIVMECSKYRPKEDQKKMKLSKTPNSVRKRTPVRRMSGSPSNYKQKIKMSTPQGIASLSSPKVGVSCKSDCKTDTSIYKSLTADCDVSMPTPIPDVVSMATSCSDPVSKTSDPSTDHTSDSGVTAGFPLTADWTTDTQKLVCPVCFMEQTGTTLDEFNTHVDTCLSKGTITQMIQEQRDNTKRLSSGPSPQSVKRKRVDSGSAAPKTKCIDTFFQKVRLETGN